MKPEWALDIRDQCVDAGVAFFFKQWGGRSPKAAGRLLEGKEWNVVPTNPRSNGAIRSSGISMTDISFEPDEILAVV